jgi:NTE family protein
LHLGSLWRLSESISVSGGSSTAAWLGDRGKALGFASDGTAANFLCLIVEPLRGLCSRTMEVGSILAGIMSPFQHPSERIAAHYRKGLFKGATLQELPSDQGVPRFSLYATSLQTGASVRFARPYPAEYDLVSTASPWVSLARVDAGP